MEYTILIKIKDAIQSLSVPRTSLIYVLILIYFSGCTAPTDEKTNSSNVNENNSSAVSCTAALKLPTITGCNGVNLLAASSINIQSSGIVPTPNGFSSSTVTRIEDEQYIDLKDEGCLQLGKDGQDFALSMWLKASGPSNDQTSGDGSQIIGSKS